MKKHFITALIALTLVTGLAGCGTTSSSSSSSNTSTAASTAAVVSSINVAADEAETIGEASTFIELGESITVNGSGATVSGSKVTITTGGTYSIKGTLADGQLIVEAADTDKVYIILNGVNISSSKGSPVYVKSSDKTVFSLAEGTKNTILDTSAASEDEDDAAIYSKDDLVFTGSGSLVTQSANEKGIVGNDDLEIENGSITVTAAKDGIVGKDTVVIANGNLVVNAGGDGIKSNNDTEAEKGYVLIEAGKINITAGEDGIQGETNAFVKNGEITIKTGGGSVNGTAAQSSTQSLPGQKTSSSKTTTTEDDTNSTKGIKAGANVIIEGGTLNIDAADDALHSNNNLIVSGGNLIINSGGDAMHSDTTLTVNSGTIDVKKSYEGIESETITIKDGNIDVVASDDAVNASGDGEGLININGGNLTVNALGDGIDSNGSINMTAGNVIVNGPTNDGNGALDYDGTFKITGGVLVAAGSSGMAQAPSSSSSQNSVKISLTQQTANTIVHIVGEDGNEVLTFAPLKQYSSLVVSSSELKTGSTYKVYVGGSSKVTAVEGIYAEGSYTKGTEIGSFTVSSSLSQLTMSGATTSNSQGGRPGK